MSADREINLTGTRVPTFLYGTAWKEDDTRRCVRDALAAGFRGIDTANQRRHYFEAEVGHAVKEAIESGAVKREDLFIQTKFTHRAGQDRRLPYDPEAPFQSQVVQSFESSLDHLHTDFIDSYVLHGPSGSPGLSNEDWEVWRAMEILHDAGRAKLIGVSNVSLRQLQEFYEQSRVKPAFVQNRCYAVQGWDKGVREYCRAKQVRYQGFSLLTANVWLLESEAFHKLVSAYACTPAQIVFSFALQVGMIPLTGTTKLAHMKEDLGAYECGLSPEDVELIENIGIKH